MEPEEEGRLAAHLIHMIYEYRERKKMAEEQETFEEFLRGLHGAHVSFDELAKICYGRGIELEKARDRLAGELPCSGCEALKVLKEQIDAQKETKRLKETCANCRHWRRFSGPYSPKVLMGICLSKKRWSYETPTLATTTDCPYWEAKDD
jgi:hypothetical protein